MPTKPRHLRTFTHAILLFTASTIGTVPLAAQALERFLPAGGNSVYEAKGLLRQWPADGPKELWRVKIGWGKSAVIESRGKAFTATETDDQQFAICLDPLTGTELWKTLLYPEKKTLETIGSLWKNWSQTEFWTLLQVGLAARKASKTLAEKGEKVSGESKPHIASPELWVDEDNREIRMYFHGLMEDGI